MALMAWNHGKTGLLMRAWRRSGAEAIRDKRGSCVLVNAWRAGDVCSWPGLMLSAGLVMAANRGARNVGLAHGFFHPPVDGREVGGSGES